MTDRIRMLTVILDRDYRDDDAESIIEAIRMVRGVGSVEWGVLDGMEVIARATVTNELYNETIEAVHDVFFPKPKPEPKKRR